ncbi:MAG: TetR/AcrR family transcriptional regulator [Alphaproteobacteria bacterium]|nr:TetR/AcrR family transcriptional regulator [Alphaproteobacteria bacterium]MBL7099786.1 TetR/AcrR family transcriptional regulator [Alphaproteobacteria bacterium]
MNSTARKSRSKPPASRGRPVGDREARRAELLDAAMSVIAQEGFAEASLRKVAERAGCTTGAVTYYFANREEMMAAVIESQFDVFDAMLRAGESDGRIDVRAGLKRWLDWLSSDEKGEWVANFQLLSLARHEPALAAVYKRRYAAYRDVFAAMIARGQRQGTIRRDIPAELLADQISAMGDGWMMLFPIEPERFQPNRVKALLDATMALIAPRTGWQ